MMKRCNEDTVLYPIDDYLAIDAAYFFKILGEPGRLKLLFLLRDREICVHHLAESLDMTVSAVSHQLRLLRQQHLVRFIKDGKKNYYTLDDNHVSKMIDMVLQHLGHEE
jgi:ArsR family transcriptional regulator